MKATHGRVVSLHYTLTDDLGVLLDTSRGQESFSYLEVEVLEVRDATEQEQAHAHVHTHGHDH
ncbi:MAG: hypothetical protein IPL59_01295 [Candidatus Competibacteraceae bacterium]|nr:hypothetical protein [Candidatus Competibacteraceae bacterium]